MILKDIKNKYTPESQLLKINNDFEVAVCIEDIFMNNNYFYLFDMSYDIFIYGKYIGKSRIDGFGMFKIEDNVLLRLIKLNKIL